MDSDDDDGRDCPPGRKGNLEVNVSGVGLAARELLHGGTALF
jgi:hypothetical protein